MPLGQGAQFAGYTVVRLLGAGGMGEVYLARHPRLPRYEALKILRADVSADADYRARFDREADLAAGLWHPHIVGVHDRGEFDGRLWIAMDYVDGADVAALLREQYRAGMPSGEVLSVVAAVAAALDYAHHLGLLHRDVKPANIMISRPDGAGGARILLSDFGIAHTLDDISGLTVTSMTVGTVDYCAPEQLMGNPADGRADQYALAATAYHLLTGCKLFSRANPVAVISAHLTVPPPLPGAWRADLAALDAVFARALAKHPAERFPRCSDFAAALAERLSGSPTGRLPATETTQPAAEPAPPAADHPAPLTVPAPVPASVTQSGPTTHANGLPRLPAALHPRPLNPPPPPTSTTFLNPPTSLTAAPAPPARRRRRRRVAAGAAALAVAAGAAAVLLVPRLSGTGEPAARATAQQQQAAQRAGRNYLEALARGDAAAALVQGAAAPATTALLTAEVLRAQLAAAPITDISVASAPQAPGDNPADVQYLVLSAKFGPALSQARIAAHRHGNDWKLDTTTVALAIGSPGSANASLQAVALWGVATHGTSPVLIFPGALQVSSTNRYIDITAPSAPLLLDALTGATDPPGIQPVATLNDVGRQAARAALDAFTHHCYRGVSPPPGCLRIDSGDNTVTIDGAGDFTNTVFKFDPATMLVAVQGTTTYHGRSATVANYTLITDDVGAVDLTKDPPVFVRTGTTG
jgi:serine/threonine protein kinase